MGVAPLTITLNNPLAKFLLPVTLCPAGLAILVPAEEMLPPGDTTTPLNCLTSEIYQLSSSIS